MPNVIATPAFDSYREAILAESCERNGPTLSLNKHCSVRPDRSKVVRFDFIIYTPDDEISFNDLTTSELKHIGEALVRLSGE